MKKKLVTESCSNDLFFCHSERAQPLLLRRKSWNGTEKRRRKRMRRRMERRWLTKREESRKKEKKEERWRTAGL